MTLWLSACPIDRRAELRTRTEDIEALIRHPDTRVIPVCGTHNLVVTDGDGVYASAVPLADVSIEPSDLVFLGERDGAALFAGFLPRDDDYDHLPGAFQDLRRVGPALGADDASVLSYARGMVYWHQQHRFCNVCGHPTEPLEAGHKRRCVNPDCAIDHFPRTDAAMIVVVHDGDDRCLLARSPRFPPGMYSALAGFLEPGESLEDCVVREVFEEVGLRVSDVRYFASQPWPFPRSIMIGFHARADDTTLALDREEIEDARWVSKDFLRDRSQWQDFSIPPRIAVARRLIDAWINGEVDGAPHR